MIATGIHPQHLTSISELGREGILAILDRAEAIRAHGVDRARLAGKIVGLLVFEPSTRTRFGFHAAAIRLGASAIELNETKYQPGMSREESLSDTVRCLSGYCDALVLRHPSSAEFQQALEVSNVPIINAGCGQESHPTQTLIDLFAIRRHFGRLEGLRIGLVGDLAGSRSSASLLQALESFAPAEVRLMAPRKRWDHPARELPYPTAEYLDHLDPRDLDVLYAAGLPAGKASQLLPESIRSSFRVDRRRLAQLPSKSIVLSPLPRIDEIATEIDCCSQAAYFNASDGALFIRMAVLDALLSSEAEL